MITEKEKEKNDIEIEERRKMTWLFFFLSFLTE